jgi:lantibiotic modifying enzyme
LYSGTIGPPLFLAALYHVTDDSIWADATRQLLVPILSSIERGDLTSWIEDGIGVGDGLGSLVYGLTWVGRWLDDRQCLDGAAAVAALVADRIHEDDRDDVLSGAAGGILALLALHSARPDPRFKKWADACGGRLEERARTTNGGAAWPTSEGRQLVGFAHGAAGIGYALHRLWRATGHDSVRRLADRAFQFVRGQYLSGERNWPVDTSRGVAPARMIAWCHGSPGVLMALAEGLSREGASDWRNEFWPALETAAEWRPTRADHLCCGTLGRCDVLLTLGRQLQQPDVMAMAVTLAAQVTERAHSAGHFRLGQSEFEYHVFDPGFFRGLSGLGYALLRLSAPSRLPSVLAFEAG